MLFHRCSTIHTCFVRFPIDVVYLDEDMRVLKIAHSLRPWRFSHGGRGARSVLELPEGTCRRRGLQEGDRLLVEE